MHEANEKDSEGAIEGDLQMFELMLVKMRLKVEERQQFLGGKSNNWTTPTMSCKMHSRRII